LQAPWALLQPLPSRHGAGPGQVAACEQVPMPVQRTSHAHEDPQSMPLVHDESPPQVTSQSPSPQMSAPWQELAWLQVILHSLAPEQLTPAPQAERPQETWQGIPAGQITWAAAHAESALQSITHTPSVQRVHAGGHAKASAPPPSNGEASAPGPPSPPGRTHRPSVHTRPSWQSPGTSQAKSGERREKLQPADAATSARITIACLMAT
jgi:hypothetical protein